MLDALFKGSEEKQKAALELHLSQGMQHLANKFYNRAMIEFKKALEIDQEAAYPRLMAELDSFSSSGELEASLAIGVNILQEKSDDFELANKLGNFARELGNWEQASNLYKMAIKANRKFEPAFYNLAATAAKVNLYDEGAKASIEQFESLDDYILPEYIGAADPAEQFQQKLLEEKEKKRSEDLAHLTTELEQKKELGAMVEAGQLEFQINQLKKEPLTVEPKEILQAMREHLESQPPEQSKTERYNFGIYALSARHPKEALWAFADLKKKEFDKLDLLYAIALDYDGHLDEAIDRVTQNLGENEYSRYNNVNLGLMFKKAGKRFLSVKYLLKTAFLLERSGGLYSMKDLVAAAEAAKNEGNLKKAYSFFEIASLEIKDKSIWLALGDILVQLKKYDEAVERFRQLKTIDPNSKEADENLKKIHDYYASKGDSLVSERKFKPALEYYRKSLSVLRISKTLKKIASVCRELGLHDDAQKYLDEVEEIIVAEKEAENEEERLALIAEAKASSKQKQWFKAIEKLESAFRMKLDKQVFLQLAGLYKGLKKTEELNSLIERWGKMLEHADRMAKYDKDKQREKQGNAEEKEK